MDVVDICNKSLAEIGYSKQIGDLYEGSPASIIAVNIYAQARDDLLRAKIWPFASRTLGLTLIKSAPTPSSPWTEAQPVPPWQYEYAYPDDCLLLRYIRPQPDASGWDDDDPQPVIFKIANDVIGSAAAKVILTNVAAALGIYTVRLTDPNLWEPNFTQALIEDLAKKFSVRLTEAANAPPQLLEGFIKNKLAEAQAAEDQADMRRG